ncbi:hypothetical protein Naga_102269g1 [Nannochloropsis gaditana]|uniref:Uncharacterized protein n=1 Tax=Nannochloropsis gaditana TaxID=72520 RepID=W7T962_9STRA|nr:hypothetical protein Naga_102269g1 [Nannochloropsis gaditana]
MELDSVYQAIVGGSSYLGTGDMNIVGEQYARVTVTLDQNGVGLTFFNGAGQTSLIYVPSFVSAVVRSQKILGAEVRYDNFSRWFLHERQQYTLDHSSGECRYSRVRGMGWSRSCPLCPIPHYGQACGQLPLQSFRMGSQRPRRAWVCVPREQHFRQQGRHSHQQAQPVEEPSARCRGRDGGWSSQVQEEYPGSPCGHQELCGPSGRRDGEQRDGLGAHASSRSPDLGRKDPPSSILRA